MTQRHRFNRYEDMRQAPADPCLVPVPAPVPAPAVAPTAPAGGMALAAGTLEGTTPR
ncbi:hypothetical protein ACFRAO_18890 [Streptomyces sp. NPDC056656]|uniref:hypothetical protein n=1 Tax=Streptomyces sp. NPDC056656 TaxID=3345895 RepID=UPI0036CFD86C